jgi:hypothetical protein
MMHFGGAHRWDQFALLHALQMSGVTCFNVDLAKVVIEDGNPDFRVDGYSIAANPASCAQTAFWRRIGNARIKTRPGFVPWCSSEQRRMAIIRFEPPSQLSGTVAGARISHI